MFHNVWPPKPYPSSKGHGRVAAARFIIESHVQIRCLVRTRIQQKNHEGLRFSETKAFVVLRFYPNKKATKKERPSGPKPSWLDQGLLNQFYSLCQEKSCQEKS